MLLKTMFELEGVINFKKGSRWVEVESAIQIKILKLIFLKILFLPKVLQKLQLNLNTISKKKQRPSIIKKTLTIING